MSKKFNDEWLIGGFVADMGKEPTALVISGLEDVEGDIREFLCCVLELYRDVKGKNDGARRFSLKLLCDSRSVTF